MGKKWLITYFGPYLSNRIKINYVFCLDIFRNDFVLDVHCRRVKINVNKINLKHGFTYHLVTLNLWISFWSCSTLKFSTKSIMLDLWNFVSMLKILETSCVGRWYFIFLVLVVIDVIRNHYVQILKFLEHRVVRVFRDTNCFVCVF